VLFDTFDLNSDGNINVMDVVIDIDLYVNEAP